MPKKSPTPLPESLRYLQPFVRALAKLPPEELNEDVDASRLDAALRKRLRGLDEEAAEAALAADREVLERWLKTEAPPDDPAHWVLGYLLAPEIAAIQTRPPQPPVRGPTIAFDPPAGWTAKPMPFRLDLKKGRFFAVIQAHDASTLELLRRQFAAWAWPPGAEPAGLRATWQTLEVTFGPCAGTKHLYLQTAPGPWKEVKYLLTVPGGHVTVDVGTLKGTDFDEAEIESRLHTIYLAPPV